MEAGVDDVAFLDAVIQEASRLIRVDRSRVYMVGHSNGGMMVHRYAAERSKHLAAAGVVAGTIGSRPTAGKPERRVPEPESPLPVILLHGKADHRMPYEGGPDPRESERVWVGAMESARFWAAANGCLTNPERTTIHEGRVTVYAWCGQEREVRLLALKGWGHAWPGPAFKKEPLPYPIDNFDAAAVIWSFFKSHSIRIEP
jgi:polyhydroxybutyrate depolymerase